MRLVTIVFLLLLYAGAGYAQDTKDRVMPPEFRSDKCSWFPDGNYADCCVEHDKDYYFGGSLSERKASDKRLKSCVLSKGKGWKRQVLANMVYYGVRIGAVSWLPTPFRWGFSHKWPRKAAKDPTKEKK